MMLRGGRLAGLASRVVGAKSFSTEIFVSRLSFYTTEEELKNLFSPFGTVEEARLVRNNQTGRPKGFGFVKYSSQADAEKAVMSRQWMKDHAWKTNFCGNCKINLSFDRSYVED